MISLYLPHPAFAYMAIDFVGNRPGRSQPASPLPDLQQVYQPAREAILQRAIELGYDPASTLLHPVNHITDLDSNNHVKVLTYANVWAQVNLRFVETFAKVLGPDAYQELFTGRGVGFTAKRMALEFKKLALPDVFLAGMRLTGLTSYGYTSTITIWSLNHRIVVPKGSCEAYFIDHRTGKRADLKRIGGKLQSFMPIWQGGRTIAIGRGEEIAMVLMRTPRMGEAPSFSIRS